MGKWPYWVDNDGEMRVEDVPGKGLMGVWMGWIHGPTVSNSDSDFHVERAQQEADAHDSAASQVLSGQQSSVRAVHRAAQTPTQRSERQRRNAESHEASRAAATPTQRSERQRRNAESHEASRAAATPSQRSERQRRDAERQRRSRRGDATRGPPGPAQQSTAAEAQGEAELEASHHSQRGPGGFTGPEWLEFETCIRKLRSIVVQPSAECVALAQGLRQDDLYAVYDELRESDCLDEADSIPGNCQRFAAIYSASPAFQDLEGQWLRRPLDVHNSGVALPPSAHQLQDDTVLDRVRAANEEIRNRLVPLHCTICHERRFVTRAEKQAAERRERMPNSCRIGLANFVFGLEINSFLLPPANKLIPSSYQPESHKLNNS